MRFSPSAKVSALIVAATLFYAPMADAAHTGGNGVEKAKETVTEMAAEVVNEDIGVGERKVHKKSGRPGKPGMKSMGARQKWTECLDMDVDEAVAFIKTARPDLKSVIKVPEGSMVTMDMRHNRVRVYYNPQGKVSRVPRVG